MQGFLPPGPSWIPAETIAETGAQRRSSIRNRTRTRRRSRTKKSAPSLRHNAGESSRTKGPSGQGPVKPSLFWEGRRGTIWTPAAQPPGSERGCVPRGDRGHIPSPHPAPALEQRPSQVPRARSGSVPAWSAAAPPPAAGAGPHGHFRSQPLLRPVLTSSQWTSHSAFHLTNQIPENR